MGFFNDVGDVVAKASDIFVTPFTATFDAVARNTTNIPVVGTTFKGFSSLYKIPGAYLRGDDQQAKDYRSEFRTGFATGGAAYLGAGAAGDNLGGGVTAGASTEKTFAAYNETGKLNANSFRGLAGALGGESDNGLAQLLSLIDQATGVPTSTTNPYVYATGMPASSTSGYDSSYINPPDPNDNSVLFYGAVAAAAFLILASKGRK